MNLNNKKVLVIEDDYHIYELIKAMLKSYEVELLYKDNGKEGLELAIEEEPDLIILDIMIPEKDGWDVCRELKLAGCDIPIIMLTAKAEEADKVLGLEIGADDYITKPFSPREMRARIKAVLRRYYSSDSSAEEILAFPNIELEIDTSSYIVHYKNEKVDVTPKEFELLSFLAQHEGQVFKREQLLDQIWGYENYSQTRTVDEHIKRVRKKFMDLGLSNSPIQTVWGVGYKFEVKGELKNV